MSLYVIHHQGAYNLFSTVTDTPQLPMACTRQEFCRWYRGTFGEQGYRELNERLHRAETNGISAHGPITLEDLIEYNRAGPDEATLPRDVFIQRYLSLPQRLPTQRVADRSTARNP